ncbi:cell division protein SepF [Scatolibacter rhodanostii]|uniref:cell division protein SepF n=1 Tax=Scatolibacter rhodanostii TaxID=2014781 RepID=UPI000C08A396|nr:cell division protein SepF [Scatolibacter rhodanostii]
MSLKDKFQNFWSVPEDELEEELEEEIPEQEETSRRLSFFSGNSRHNDTSSHTQRNESEVNNVVNISGKTKVKVALFKPVSFGEETRVIADELIQKHTVIVNLEATERETSRRIIDFLSGVAYAYGGSIKRIASGTFIIIPYNVDLKGDSVVEEIENGNYF